LSYEYAVEPEGEGEGSKMPELIIECKSCKGTGLFKGSCERGASAVVCYSCRGTGKTTFQFDEFIERKPITGVARVYEGSFGYVISSDDSKREDGTIIRYSKYGCTYEEWLSGKKPLPIKDLYCPYVWKNTGIGNEPLERCKRHCKGFGSITNCEVYADKQTCWELYDAIKRGDE